MPYWLRWTILMTMLGLATAAIVYAVTGSLWWGAVGLLGAGVIANAFVSARAGTNRPGKAANS
jgi:hypothetical protein